MAACSALVEVDGWHGGWWWRGREVGDWTRWCGREKALMVLDRGWWSYRVGGGNGEWCW